MSSQEHYGSRLPYRVLVGVVAAVIFFLEAPLLILIIHFINDGTVNEAVDSLSQMSFNKEDDILTYIGMDYDSTFAAVSVIKGSKSFDEVIELLNTKASSKEDALKLVTFAIKVINENAD